MSNLLVLELLLLYLFAREQTIHAFVSTTRRGRHHQQGPRFIPQSGHEATSPLLSSSSLQSVPTPLDTLTSGLASICRMPNGVTVRDDLTTTSSNTPDATMELLQLYDVENSRDCRLVRERITELDLCVKEVIPSAPNSRVYKDANDPYALPAGSTLPQLVLAEEGGSKQTLVGETQILSYLDAKFSGASASIADNNNDDDPKAQALALLQTAGNYVASILRFGRGSQASKAATASTRPAKPLILYSYEGNQFCRLVREVLTELDLVYELRSAGKGSPRRSELASITRDGSTTQPYLIDPNTSTQMGESKDICAYLYREYAKFTPPSELWQAAGVAMSYAQPIFKVLAPLQAGSFREDKLAHETDMANAGAEVEQEIESADVVVYTYSLSPFCIEAKTLLDRLGVDYKEVSLGSEWIPGLIAQGGAAKRAALLEMTGQSSLPQIFVRGKPIGGLCTGTPGLVPALEDGSFQRMMAGDEEEMSSRAS